ncbi:MAG: polysaccharide deacetylase family protein [Armatimonadota bacterium]
MVKRRSRNRRNKSNRKRGFGCLVIIILLLVSLFLVTCRKQQDNNTYSTGHPNISQTRKHSSKNDSHHPKKTYDTPIPQPAQLPEPAPTARQEDKGPDTNQNIPASTSPMTDKNDTAASVDEREFSRGDAIQKQIALTFDAGASAKPAEQILKILTKHNIKCTFFLTGKWMEQNRSMTRQIGDAGHEIGNHSYSHKSFIKLTDSEIANEVIKTDLLAIEISNQSTKPLFRCPFGARDKRVLKALADQGYKSVYWDIDSWDSVMKDITSKQIEDRILEKVRNGSVILMHCGSQPTADALDSLLTKLESKGYEPVTVSQLARL